MENHTLVTSKAITGTSVATLQIMILLLGQNYVNTRQLQQLEQVCSHLSHYSNTACLSPTLRGEKSEGELI